MHFISTDVTPVPTSLPLTHELELSGQRLLAVTEEELQRLVLDIHDGPVQSLFAALSQIAVVQSRMAAIPGAVEATEPELGRAAEMLQQALLDLRTMLTAFHAPEFARKSVGDIAEELVVQFETLTNGTIALDVAIDEQAPTPPVIVKIAMYRILQEALANIRRHAGVNSGNVRLYHTARELQLQVVDAGRGFEPPPLAGPQATEQFEHIGLRGMRERAAMVGGAIQVTSKPGAGTHLVLRIPVG
jgi:signal transduction histidine kinase